MRLKETITLSECAKLLGCRFLGNPDLYITGINEIHSIVEGDLVFADHPKYYDKALNSIASVVIVDNEMECPRNMGLIISANPFDDFNSLLKQFSPFKGFGSPKDKNIKLGKKVVIHPNVSIGHNVSIGDNCILHAGVVVYDNCEMGSNVIVHANTVIGSDAFYYKQKNTEFHRLHTCGKVIVEDNVEIGASSTVDRGVTGNTTIGKGSKIDNQVHIGHDVTIGRNCLFAAQVGIAGCVTIGDGVTLWGQVGVVSDITIGDNAVVLGQAGIGKNLKGGITYFGSPADEARAKFKEMAALRKLPDVLEDI